MARNLLTNSDFETGDSTGWDYFNGSGSSSISVVTDEPHQGTYCAKMVVDGSNNYVGFSQDSIVVIGQPYKITLWAKATGGNYTFEGLINQDQLIIPTTEWKQYTFTAIAVGTKFSIKRNSAAGHTAYFDQIRVEPVVKYAVLTRTLSNDISSPDTDFFVEDFGTPKASIVFMSNAHPSGNPDVHAVESVGFLTGYDSQVCAMGCSTGGVTTSATYRSLPTSRIAKACTNNGTSNAEYSATRVDNSGITITMDTDNTSNERYATVIMFTGHDVEAYDGIYNPSNGTKVTGVGFKPNMILFCGAGTPFGNANQTYNIWSFGAAKQRPSVMNYCINAHDQPGAATMNCTTLLSDVRVSMQITNTISWSCELDAFNADGFEQTVTGSTAGDYVGFLALKIPGVNMDIQSIQIPGYTGNVQVSGVGFQPGLVIGCLGGNALPHNMADHLTLSFGVSDGTTEASYGVNSVDNVGTSECGSKYSTTLFNRPNPSGSDYTTGTINSFNADGYTINWTNIGESASGVYGFVIAFQNQNDKRLVGNTTGKLYFKT